MKKYIIANQNILMDLPSELLHTNFKGFEGEFEKADVVITLCEECDNCSFFNNKNCKKIVAEDDTVFYSENFMKVDFNEPNFLHSVCFQEISGVYHIKCKTQKKEKYTQYDCDEFFDRIKGAVFYAFQKNKYYVLHSSSVIINGKVYAFSALSGTGKTTHTKYLKKVLGCATFNGDLMAISESENKVYAYALPWCGESGEFTNKNLPLGGIIFLSRGRTNNIEKISGFDAEMMLIQRFFAVNFTDSAVEELIQSVNEFSENINFAHLYCLPTIEAGETSAKFILNEMGSYNNGNEQI